MTDRLKARRCIVTGASSGIGEQIAYSMAAEGARVAVLARREQESQQVVAKICDNGGQAFAVCCDVSDSTSAKAAVSQAVEQLGGLDTLVNNAGGAFSIDRFPEESEQGWQDTLDVNLNGPFFMSRAAWPHLITNGGGSIVNISSLSAFAGVGQSQLAKMGAQPPASYSAAKAGLEGFSAYIAGVGGEHNIRVNCVAPGRILTPQWQDMLGEEGLFWPFYRDVQMLKQHGRAEDVANAVIYLASDEAAFVTGQLLQVNGGAVAKL